MSLRPVCCAERCSVTGPRGIPLRPHFAPPSVTADPGPLNRAEWVKFVAAFFNKELDANSVFAGIKVG